MNTWQGTLWGFLCIATVVVVGILHANDPDRQHWPMSKLNSDCPTSTPASIVSVNRIDWSADGRVLLSLSRGGDNAEGQLALHDITVNAGSLPIDLMGKKIGAFALAPDGHHVLFGSCDGHLLWLSIEALYDPTLVLEVSPATTFTAAAVAGDGRQLAAGTRTGTIYVGATDRQSFVALTSSHASSVGDLGFSPDGNLLVAAQADGLVSLWDVATGKLLQEFIGHEQPTRVEFLPDGKRIISAGYDDTVRIWGIDCGRELWRGEFGFIRVQALAVSADGSTATWGGLNHRIVVWDLERGKMKADIATPNAVFDLKFSPDGSHFASGGTDGTIRLYGSQTGIERSGIEIDGW